MYAAVGLGTDVTPTNRLPTPTGGTHPVGIIREDVHR
jgi:hypothetical protein